MSLFGNFALGANALQGQSAALQAISNNIANSSTVGYKTSKVQFQEFLSSNEYPASLQHSEQRGHMHGIEAFRTTYINEQGNIANTGRGLDIAIVGRGFFTTTSDLDATGRAADDAARFTRDGNFVKEIQYPDSSDQTVGDLYLTNKSGNYLVGFPVDNGTVSSVAEPISIRLDQNAPELPGRATSAVTYEAILPSEAEEGDFFHDGTTIYDGSETPVALSIDWTKGADPNSWSVQFSVDGGPTTTIDGIVFAKPTAGSQQESAGQGNMPFPSQFSVTLDNGQAITIDISNTAQYATDIVPGKTTQDGFAAGDLVDLSFDSSGYLVGNFSNGVAERLYRLPIAYFTNDNGLVPGEGNDYRQTPAAGEQSYYFAGGTTEDGMPALGSVIPEAVENSTTDIADEFTDLIQTQRAYQMATKIISTTDEMTRTALDTKG
jgi:flagellar hook protein FlgE